MDIRPMTWLLELFFKWFRYLDSYGGGIQVSESCLNTADAGSMRFARPA